MDSPGDWPFVPPYDPTTYEPARPSLTRRLAIEAKTIVLTAAARTLLFAAAAVIGQHAVSVYGGM